MKRVLSLLLCMSFLQACSSAGLRNESALGQVKKVAVIGFKAYLPAKSSVGLFNGSLGSSKGGEMGAQQSPVTEELLAKFTKTLEQKQKWKVLNITEMKNNPGYKTAFDQTMKGFQNKSMTMPEQGIQEYVAKDMMDADSARILKPEGREKLMKDLQVDTIINLTVRTTLQGTAVMGIGSRKPLTTIMIEAYTRGTEERIWAQQLNGEKSSESLGMTGMWDEEKMKQLALQSAESAYQKIGTN